MTTIADMISEVEDHLMSGERDAFNELDTDISDTDDTITFTMPFDPITVGAYLGIDLEVVYVKALDSTSSVATIRRGMVGSTATAHAAGALVYIDPIFSKWQIWKALNVEIDSLSGADNGLFAETAFTLQTQSVRRTYDIPVLNNDLRQILEIRYDSPGAENYWPEVPKRNCQVIRDVITDATNTSGLSIRIDDSFVPGRDLVVRYMGDFTTLTTTLTDDAVATTRLGPTMVDIPAIGAAARLMAVKGAKRTFIERSVDTRRAAEVPTNASSQAYMVLKDVMNGRIKSEAARLRQRWPDSFR
jgi:hypothetical protein